MAGLLMNELMIEISDSIVSVHYHSRIFDRGKISLKNFLNILKLS